MSLLSKIEEKKNKPCEYTLQKEIGRRKLEEKEKERERKGRVKEFFN